MALAGLRDLFRNRWFRSIAAYIYHRPASSHTHDGRLLSSGQRFQSADLQSHLDQGLESLGSLHRVLFRVLAVFFHVEPDGGALASRPAQSEDDPAPVLELDVQALVLRDRMVDRVGVAEITGLLDLEGGRARGSAQVGSDERLVGKEVSEGVHDLVGTGLDLLVVVPAATHQFCQYVVPYMTHQHGSDLPGEEAPSVLLVVLLQDLLDGLALFLLVGSSQDGQPGCHVTTSAFESVRVPMHAANSKRPIRLTNNGPETVLLSDVVGTSSERLFSADGKTSSIHQVAKELPTCIAWTNQRTFCQLVLILLYTHR